MGKKVVVGSVYTLHFALINKKVQLIEHQSVGLIIRGAGGIRTRVRTKRRNAFYMLIS